jgi:hypothetical protein
MKLTPIPANKVDSVWFWAGPQIERSCKHSLGLETADDLYRKVTTGDGYMLVTVDDNTALVFERAGRFLHLVAMGGVDMVKRVGELVNASWMIAGHIGCSGLSFRGRKGWNRLLKKHGFQDVDGFMEASL